MASPFATATPTACEKLELIVEIVGNIPTDYSDQRIIICNKDDRYDQALTDKVKKDNPIDDGKLASALHRCDWKTEQQAHLWLEVKSSEGTPIRIPMLNGELECQKALATPLKTGLHTQDNLIVPIVPTTELARQRYLKGQLGAMASANPVLCRAGWLYIFKNGNLWREIEIRQEEKSGITTYHDVRLHGQGGCIDQADGTVPTDQQRKSIGIGLEEIWIPARWNTMNESIQLFYAESQLTPQRLNAYITDPSLLAKRSHQIKSMRPRAIMLDILNNTSNIRQSMPYAPFFLGGEYEAKPHIPRDIEREMLLLDPTAFLKDPNELNRVFNQSKNFYADIGYPATENNGIPIYQKVSELTDIPENVTAHAWAYHIKAKLNEELCVGPPTEVQLKDPDSPWHKYNNTPEDKAIWAQTSAEAAALQSQTKALAKAIDKKICGLYVFDPLYWLAHLHTLIQHHWTLQKLLPDVAAFRTHHGSAFLVENIMREVGKQDKDDPRYKAVNSYVKDNSKKRIDFALGATERNLVKKRVKQLQKLLYDTLSHNITEQAIKDTTSCTGWDKLGGCAYLANLLNSFISPNLTDPLAAPSAAKQNYSLERKAAMLINEGNPYFKVLFNPKEDTTELLEPYQKSTITKVEPRGDGLWQPEVMAELENTQDSELSSLITGDKLLTLQGNIAAMKADLGLEYYTSMVNKSVGSLFSYAGNVGNIVKRLSNEETAQQAEVEKTETTSDNLKREEQRLQNEQQALNEELNKTQTQQSQVKTNLANIDKQIANEESHKRRLIVKHATAVNNVNKRIAQLNATINAPTVTDGMIMSWINPNGEERELQSVVSRKRSNIQKQVNLYQKQQLLTQQESTLKQQIELKQQEIVKVQERIQGVRNNAANNKRITVSRGKATYITLDLARELASESLGNPKIIQDPKLSLDANGKVQLAAGEWVTIGMFDDSAVEGVGDGRRKSIHNAEIALIKLDSEGNVIGPKGVNKSQLASALANGQEVVIRGAYIGFNRKSAFYKRFRNARDALKLELSKLRAQYNNLADTHAAVINSKGAVDKEIAELQKQYESEVKEQIDRTNAYEQKQIEQKQQALDQAIENRDQLAQEIEANQRRIDELNNSKTQTAEERAELNRRQTEINQQRKQHSEQIANCETKQAELATAKGQLEASIGELAQRRLRLQGNSLFSNFSTKAGRVAAIGAYKANAGLVKVMQSPSVPFLILGFEIYNIKTFVSKVSEQGASLRALVDFASLAMNIAAAVEGVTAVMAADKVLYEMTYVTTSRYAVPAFLARRGIVFSTRFLLQGPAALLLVGLSAWDICNDIAEQDWGALAGDLIILGGAITGLVATILGAGALIAGATVGWLIVISFALFFLGAYIKAKFSDTPFDKWLKFGPFADPTGKTDYAHLQQEDIAFYRLLDLLANLNFKVETVSLKDMTEQQWALFSGGEKRPDTLVVASLTTSLPGLLTSPKEYYLVGDIRVGLSSPQQYPKLKQEPEIPTYYYQQLTSMGVNFYFDATNDIKNIVVEDVKEIEEVWRTKRRATEAEIDSLNHILFSYHIRYLARFQLKFLDANMNKWLLPFKKVSLTTHTMPTKENEKLPDVKPLFFHEKTPDYWFTQCFDITIVAR